jgi:hypothetical protein
MRASFSSDVSRRGPSSLASPFMATISSARTPESVAATARSCERSAHSSCASRLMPSSRETLDACWIMWQESNVEMSPSCVIESTSSPFPSR